MSYDFIIVGAGLFGSTFACEAQKLGYKCLVVDKRIHIGGNIYTEKYGPIDIHRYGAHIFHTNSKKIWNYVNKITPFRQYVNSPVANFNGRLYSLPFNMNTFYQLWGCKTPQEAARIIESQRKRIKNIKNLEDQAISLVGEDIYKILIKGYTEKQWGRDCKDLPPEIIKRLPIRYLFDNNYFNDVYQGIPEEGYTKLTENQLKGVEVILNTNFIKDKEYFESNCRKKIIFTGPIDSYFDYSEGALEYRSLNFETEILDIENYQGVPVMNFTDRETPYTRIIEHKHFLRKVFSKTIITREYPIEGNNNEPYYPINDIKNSGLYDRYKALAEKEKYVIFGGRLGEYKYYDMDKVISSSLKLCSEIL